VVAVHDCRSRSRSQLAQRPFTRVAPARSVARSGTIHGSLPQTRAGRGPNLPAPFCRMHEDANENARGRDAATCHLTYEAVRYLIHPSHREACSDWSLTVLTRRFLGISRGPSPNASHAGDTPSALASDSSTSTPVCAPFSMSATVLGLSPTSRARAAFVNPRSHDAQRQSSAFPHAICRCCRSISGFCSPSPYPNQPALTPKRRSQDGQRLPTVGIRSPDSICFAVTLLDRQPTFGPSADRLQTGLLPNFAQDEAGRPKWRGLGEPRTIGSS
jgi:hypothetical protein